MNAARFRWFRCSRVPLGILAILIVLLLNLLAAAPALHELVHPDAGNPDHECAITLFAHGQVDAPVANVPVTVPVGVAENFPQYILPSPEARAALLPPERAPPLVSSPA